jgi:hypothetical protein
MEDLFLEHMVPRATDTRSMVFKLCTVIVTALAMYLSFIFPRSTESSLTSCRFSWSGSRGLDTGFI